MARYLIHPDERNPPVARYLILTLDDETVIADTLNTPAKVVLRLTNIADPAGLATLVQSANGTPAPPPKRTNNRSATPPRTGLRWEVLAALEQLDAATSHDVGAVLDHPVDSTSACLSQMHQLGWVEWNDSVISPTGSACRRYQITPAGRASLTTYRENTSRDNT